MNGDVFMALDNGPASVVVALLVAGVVAAGFSIATKNCGQGTQRERQFGSASIRHTSVRRLSEKQPLCRMTAELNRGSYLQGMARLPRCMERRQFVGIWRRSWTTSLRHNSGVLELLDVQRRIAARRQM
jgi:hypothetical protein